MTSSPLSSGLRHWLIQQLAAKQQRSKAASSKGFTLIELLVVVIIIGILAAVALPGFLSQSDKAKAASAKAMVSSAVKECQVYLIEAGGTFNQQVDSTNEITIDPLPPGTCVGGGANTWEATIVSSGSTYTAVLNADGTVTQTCTPGTADPALCSGTW
jgi:prepilin-type N-terminal cleavage/methylation domain-containing protein